MNILKILDWSGAVLALLLGIGGFATEGAWSDQIADQEAGQERARIGSIEQEIKCLYESHVQSVVPVCVKTYHLAPGDVLPAYNPAEQSTERFKNDEGRKAFAYWLKFVSLIILAISLLSKTADALIIKSKARVILSATRADVETNEERGN